MFWSHLIKNALNDYMQLQLPTLPSFISGDSCSLSKLFFVTALINNFYLPRPARWVFSLLSFFWWDGRIWQSFPFHSRSNIEFCFLFGFFFRFSPGRIYRLENILGVTTHLVDLPLQLCDGRSISLCREAFRQQRLLQLLYPLLQTLLQQQRAKRYAESKFNRVKSLSFFFHRVQTSVACMVRVNSAGNCTKLNA